MLDGGWRAWEADGSAVSKEELAVKPTTPTLTAHPDRLATREQVLG